MDRLVLSVEDQAGMKEGIMKIAIRPSKDFYKSQFVLLLLVKHNWVWELEHDLSPFL